MARLVFTREFGLPIVQLRGALDAALPQYRWTVSEAGLPIPGNRHDFPSRIIVTGTSPTGRAALTLVASPNRLPAAPSNSWHIGIEATECPEGAVRERVVVALAAPLLALGGDGAMLQRDDGGNWLSASDTQRIGQMLAQGQDLSLASLFGVAADRFGSAAAPAASGQYDPGLDHLTLLSLVATARLVPHRGEPLGRALTEAFPLYTWHADGGADIIGRKLVVGAMPGRKLSVLLDGRREALPRVLAAPPHRHHVRVAIDSGRDLALARRVALLVCATLIRGIDDEAHFQLDNRGNWLTHFDCAEAAALPRQVADIGAWDRQAGRTHDAFSAAQSWMEGTLPAPDDGLVELYRSIAVTVRGGVTVAGATPVAMPAPRPVAAAVPSSYTPAAPRPVGFGLRGAGGGFGRRTG